MSVIERKLKRPQREKNNHYYDWIIMITHFHHEKVYKISWIVWLLLIKSVVKFYGRSETIDSPDSTHESTTSVASCGVTDLIALSN